MALPLARHSLLQRSLTPLLQLDALLQLANLSATLTPRTVLRLDCSAERDSEAV